MSAATYYNRILGHSATELVNALAHTGTGAGVFPITHTDVPYYFLRLHELQGDPEDVNPYTDISASGWYSITVAHDVSGPIEQELLFLSDLGLAMQVGDTGEYLVNPIVDNLLYGTNGLFHMTDASPTAEENFKEYMRDTVLPGYFLLYRYLRRGLSTEIHLSREAEARMREIMETIWLLNGRI
jgi:hypothetical protein